MDLETVVTAAIVALITTIVSEPLKKWLYRNKHIEERRYQVQVEQIPRLVEAYGWAAAASVNAHSGWQVEDRQPFDYVNNALSKIIEAVNLGVSIGYLFPTELRDQIATTSESLRALMNDVQIEKNMGGKLGSRLEKPNQKIFDILRKVTAASDSQRETLQTRYRALLGLGE